MRSSTWTNKDGIQVGFGTRDTRNVEAGGIETVGQLRQVEQEVYFDITNTGASVRKAVIPAGAVILSSTLRVKEAFVGGTSLAIGTVAIDGTNPVAAGLVTATQGAVANLVLDAVIKGTGAGVSAATTAATNLTYTMVGTFTAGRASVLVEYIMPSA